MPAGVYLLAVLLAAPALWADCNATPAPPGCPSYTADKIVSSADFQPGSLAPNAIGTIFGSNLAYTTRAVQGSDITAGQLPSVLPTTGVRVLVGNLQAGIYYVSPTQINFLVPADLLPGPVTVQVVVNSLAGPAVTVQLVASAPAFYQLNPQTVIATDASGNLLTTSNPANPGDIVILYGTGLGQVVPPLEDREIPTGAAPIKSLGSLQIALNGSPLGSGNVLYAGAAPGFAGLYQINLRLPSSLPSNPQIQIQLGSQASPTGIILPVTGNR